MYIGLTGHWIRTKTLLALTIMRNFSMAAYASNFLPSKKDEKLKKIDITSSSNLIVLQISTICKYNKVKDLQFF